MSIPLLFTTKSSFLPTSWVRYALRLKNAFFQPEITWLEKVLLAAVVLMLFLNGMDSLLGRDTGKANALHLTKLKTEQAERPIQ